MSRLASRIGQLERNVGRCRDCRTAVELVGPGAANSHKKPEQQCPSCREPVERIAVLLAFDPDAGAQA